MTESRPGKPIDIAAVARSYNILAYDGELRALAAHVFPDQNFDNVKKPDLHHLINGILLEQFKGESTLKARLVHKFADEDVIAAFEIKVNKSRADFLSINGDTKSFEIKSELDNLQKLPKQIGDYQQVFDFNYLVIDETHYKNALKLTPAHYGILVLHGMDLMEDRPAALNSRLNPMAQLRLFTKKELASIFRIPGITAEEIVMNFDEEEINQWFKRMLKDRYSKRWQFLMQHRQQINPVDYQFFFQHNIAPNIIYGSC